MRRATSTHVPVLHGLAQVAAQALANAALHAELEQTAGRMTLMTEASLEFSSSLDLQDTLVKVGRRLCAAVDVPNCDIDLVRDDGTTYRLMSLTDGAVDSRLDRHLARLSASPDPAPGLRDARAGDRRVARRPATHRRGPGRPTGPTARRAG